MTPSSSSIHPVMVPAMGIVMVRPVGRPDKSQYRSIGIARGSVNRDRGSDATPSLKRLPLIYLSFRLWVVFRNVATINANPRTVRIVPATAAAECCRRKRACLDATPLELISQAIKRLVGLTHLL